MKQGIQLKDYTVTRIVKEVFEVRDCESRQAAINQVNENGDPSEVTVIKQTAKPKTSNKAKKKSVHTHNWIYSPTTFSKYCPSCHALKGYNPSINKSLI